MKLIDSLTYEPVPLSFGTSGLRGLAKDMTDLECYINTVAFLSFLQSKEGLSPESTVYIAGDLRESTPRITRSVIKAAEDAGHSVVYCGLIPTPALAYHALQKKSPCVMVTGSHIPADRNGIKFYKSNGEVLKSDEPLIKKHVSKIREVIYQQEVDETIFSTEGMLVKSNSLPPIDASAEENYKKRYAVENLPLRGKHIIFYDHSAVGRDLVSQLLESLGAQVTKVGRSDTFISIDTENVTQENKEYFSQLAKDYPGNFAIVSTDGDSDRPFVIDETGEFHRGDIVGCITATELGADFACIPISSNDAVDDYLRTRGVGITHTKIGSPYVIEGMESADGAKSVVGWEVNGGFLTQSTLTFNGLELMALPTRDAVLPILAVLLYAAKKSIKISEVFAELPQKYTGAALLDNVDDKAINILRNLSEHQDQTKELIHKYLNSDDLGEVTEVDFLDGARIHFTSRDIVHIRPSGNAPQLRIYTNCDSQKRADELAANAVKDGGLLENFIDGIV